MVFMDNQLLNCKKLFYDLILNNNNNNLENIKSWKLIKIENKPVELIQIKIKVTSDTINLFGNVHGAALVGMCENIGYILNLILFNKSIETISIASNLSSNATLNDELLVTCEFYKKGLSSGLSFSNFKIEKILIQDNGKENNLDEYGKEYNNNQLVVISKVMIVYRDLEINNNKSNQIFLKQIGNKL